MRNNAMRPQLIGITLLLLALTGCATTTQGPLQRIGIESDPSGATIDAIGCGVSIGALETPTTIMVIRRAKRCLFSISHSGYYTATVPLERVISDRLGENFDAMAIANCDDCGRPFVESMALAVVGLAIVPFINSLKKPDTLESSHFVACTAREGSCKRNQCDRNQRPLQERSDADPRNGDHRWCVLPPAGTERPQLDCGRHDPGQYEKERRTRDDVAAEKPEPASEDDRHDCVDQQSQEKVGDGGASAQPRRVPEVEPPHTGEPLRLSHLPDEMSTEYNQQQCCHAMSIHEDSGPLRLPIHLRPKPGSTAHSAMIDLPPALVRGSFRVVLFSAIARARRSSSIRSFSATGRAASFRRIRDLLASMLSILLFMLRSRERSS
jgi:hypothetical protein